VLKGNLRWRVGEQQMNGKKILILISHLNYVLKGNLRWRVGPRLMGPRNT